MKAGAVVKVAAAAVGGGGGGRDNMAQAGGKDPDKLPDALAAARAEIERALAGVRRARLRLGALRRRGQRSHGDARDAARAGAAAGDQEGLRGAEGA